VYPQIRASERGNCDNVARTSLSAKAAERKLESQATITIEEARARALKVFLGKVMNEELEKERGGSRLH